MSNPLKKTMVFLGLAEEDLDTNETSTPAESPAPAPRQSSPKAQVTPLRRVTPTKAPVAQPMSEILTVHPTEYRDAAQIAESFREGIPVILNLSRMNDSEARRLIDFASGLSMGLHGRIERVTAKVFLLSPEHVASSSGEQDDHTDGDSFFMSRSA